MLELRVGENVELKIVGGLVELRVVVADGIVVVSVAAI